jgi:hypothetical protein
MEIHTLKNVVDFGSQLLRDEPYVITDLQTINWGL